MIPTTTVLAIHCIGCGEIEYISLSLFSFSGSNSVTLNCSCGYELAKITTKKRKDFWIQYTCAMCEDRHLLKVAKNRLWFNETDFDLLCEETDIEVGYIGSIENIKEKIEKQDQFLVEWANKPDFVNRAPMMYEVLEYVYDMAENDRLFCACGSYEIEIEIVQFSDNIMLTCERCKAAGKIMTDKGEDFLQILKKTRELKLTRTGLSFNKNRGL